MFVFVGSLPILWKAKRQGAIQSSTYGAEFLAGRTAVEEAGALRYLLRSLGVPIVGPTPIYGDCMGMIQSCSIPEGTLKKKHRKSPFCIIRRMKGSVRSQFAILRVTTRDGYGRWYTGFQVYYR